MRLNMPFPYVYDTRDDVTMSQCKKNIRSTGMNRNRNSDNTAIRDLRKEGRQLIEVHIKKLNCWIRIIEHVGIRMTGKRRESDSLCLADRLWNSVEYER
jgi:hypothetical protein